MFVVLGNLRFMVFLLIFSGFWIMFWQEFIALPLFIRGYVNPNADVDLLTTVDPLAVILFQILISFLTRKARPFTAMTAGILITSLSWLILAVCDLSLADQYDTADRFMGSARFRACRSMPLSRSSCWRSAKWSSLRAITNMSRGSRRPDSKARSWDFLFCRSRSASS